MTPCDAVVDGDIARILQFHSEGALAGHENGHGGLLRLAVDSGREDVLSLLLELGLDPDARLRLDPEEGRETFTWGMPLYECARHGKRAMAEILLRYGADANGQVYASGTPLSEAYGQRDDDMVALLERHGGVSNASMAGLYRRKDLALKLLAKHGDTVLPDDGFSRGTVAGQLIGGAARGGDPEVLKLGMDRVDWPQGDSRWYGAAKGTLGFWNHWYGPWCHQEWDRTAYLTCFRMLLERAGPPPIETKRRLFREIAKMGDHVTDEERAAFTAAAVELTGSAD